MYTWQLKYILDIKIITLTIFLKKTAHAYFERPYFF